MDEGKIGCAVVAVLLLAAAVLFGFNWCSRHLWGNKQIIDFNRQEFKAAWVLGDQGRWEKIPVKVWKDWENSDAVQIVKPDGSYVYTHLMNVKLVSE